MKKTAAVILLFALAICASVTSYGQKSSAKASKGARVQPAPQNFVQFQDTGAYSDGQGSLITWQMAFETRNIGFYVYRVTADGPQQLVRPTAVGGFSTKTQYPTGYGEKYELYDPSGTLATQYVVQAFGSDGRRSASNIISPKYTDNFERDTGHDKGFWESGAIGTNGQLDKCDPRLTKELQTIVNEATLPPNLNMHLWVVSQPGVKITVRQDGLYRVLRSELQNAGFNVNSDSNNWRLFMEGNEQGIIIGLNDQYIEFFGRSLDTAESDARAYYFIADSVAGKRIPSKILSQLGGNVTSTRYNATAERRERTQYYSNIKNGDAQNYFGRLISDTPTTFPDPLEPNYTPFNIDNIDFNAPTATVTIRLQGFYPSGARSTLAAINGHEIGTVSGVGQESYAASFTVPTSFLLEGPNMLTLTAASGDFSLFDTVTVDYGRKYVSNQNRLLFYSPGYRRVDVTSFTAPNLRVFDVTYDGNPQLISNTQVIDNGGGQYSVRIPSDRSALFYAVDKSAVLQPASIAANNPSTLASSANSADLIIISHSQPDFISASQAWRNYRQTPAGGGFSVKVVDVEDIMDEFGYGARSSAALRDFLQYAKDLWQSPKPRYVLMLGDATTDPRNYQNFGYWDLVPTKYVDLIYGEVGTDEALADFDHDGRAELAIGRIPARTAFQIGIALNKSIAFETPAMQDLSVRGTVMASDGQFGFDFRAMNGALLAELPPRTPAVFVDRMLPPPNPNNDPDPMAHQNLINALNTGPYIVNYAGHGASGVWGSTDFFSVNHVQELTSPNQSIYTMLTCFNGLFFQLTNDSMAETLLKSQGGGAVATWASTTETTPDLQLLMGARFYNQIGEATIKRMGDLVADAKATIPPGTDVGYSWALLGDPTLKVRQ